MKSHEPTSFRRRTVYSDYVLPTDHLLQRHHVMGSLLPRILLLSFSALGGQFNAIYLDVPLLLMEPSFDLSFDF